MSAATTTPASHQQGVKPLIQEGPYRFTSCLSTSRFAAFEKPLERRPLLAPGLHTLNIPLSQRVGKGDQGGEGPPSAASDFPQRSISNHQHATFSLPYHPPTMRVQIAGISTLEDALACERAGVDAIGFTIGLPTGPHNGLDAIRAMAIIRHLPPFVTPVLITYFATAGEVVPLCNEMGVTCVQLHGGAEASEVAAMRAAIPGLKVIRAVHVTGPGAIDQARAINDADAIILDTYDPATGRHGATGKTHDWSLSRAIVEAVSTPVILAGGLNPDNVADAIRQVRPWAVDTHTGVERPDGATDHERIAAFVHAARASAP